MASCLGLYIEKNIIKYAKVSKEHETLKVEAFGIKFYDKIGDTINQIISETYSFKIPVSINLSEEMYNYFYMFSLLNQNDLKKAISTEFESYCFDKNINKNSFETKYALTNSAEEKDKVKIIHIAANKTNIAKINQLMEGYKVSTITPLATSIANVIPVKLKENAIIVNLESETTITSIVNQKIYNVQKIKEGSEEILEKIAAKENSYSKAYEICKNSTIYTMEGKELQDEENEYLEDIMPTLYKIVTKIQEYIANTTIKFNTIYITGLMSVVNNIDLYFQEFFTIEKCEILKPYFINENVKINIKDYIEVNSAIGLALQGLGYGIKELNFKNPSLADRLPQFIGGKKSEDSNSSKSKLGLNFDFSDLNTKLDVTEKWLVRTAGGILILTVLYSGFSIFLNEQMKLKISEAEEVIQYTQSQIALVEQDTNKVKMKTNRYIELTENLTNLNKKLEEDSNAKNSIPNLLVELMSIIPDEVQLLSIENTTEKNIVINAQSKYYEQLGYFKAKIKEDMILENVTSSKGTKDGEFVKVVIEGVLP